MTNPETPKRWVQKGEKGLEQTAEAKQLWRFDPTEFWGPSPLRNVPAVDCGFGLGTGPTQTSTAPSALRGIRKTVPRRKSGSRFR